VPKSSNLADRRAVTLTISKRFASADYWHNTPCAEARFRRQRSEFSGRLLDLWASHHGVQIDFSRPGKPTDNCFIETFNGSLRDECLNVHWFESLEDAKEKIEGWRRNYNESRPHQAVNEQTPA